MNEKNKIYLTGIRPTANSIHLGNYFGAIKPMIDINEKNKENVFIFIADLHGLIGNNNIKEYQNNIIQQYSIFKAFGFKNIFLQSDILEITQIEKYFDSYINLGKLQRIHSIKNELENNKKEYGKIKNDLFNYPVLMAADIIGIGADYVFLGNDQKQHLEVTKEICQKINSNIGIHLKIPNGLFPDFQEVIGLDGRKMSKSYGNYIDPFENEKKLLKQINLIQTDNTPLGERKDFENCNIIKIFKLFDKTGENLTLLEQKYEKGSIGYGETKKMLFEQILSHFEQYRKTKVIYSNKEWKEIKKELEKTGKKVRKYYQKTLNEIKKGYGLTNG